MIVEEVEIEEAEKKLWYLSHGNGDNELLSRYRHSISRQEFDQKLLDYGF